MTTETAIIQLRTWFRAVGIVTENPERTGCLVVTDASGTKVEIVVDGDHGMVVSSKDILGRKVQHALTAFRRIQEALGYEPKDPVNRGTTPVKKLGNNEDFDLAAFRHTEFRRVPNDPAALERYADTIKNSVIRAFRIRRDSWNAMGFDKDDLTTYARVWATSYVGLYELRFSSHRDNCKLMFRYINQRFRELASKRSPMTVCAGQVVDCGDDKTNSFTKYGTPDGKNTTVVGLDGSRIEHSAVDDDDDYVERHRELNTHSKRARRDSAAEMLEAKLAAMDHTTMVLELQRVTLSHCAEWGAKKEAARRLATHAAKCEKCSLKVDKDATRTNLGSVDESITDAIEGHLT